MLSQDSMHFQKSVIVYEFREHPVKNYLNDEYGDYDVTAQFYYPNDFIDNNKFCFDVYGKALLTKFSQLSRSRAQEFIDYQLLQFVSPVDWLHDLEKFIELNKSKIENIHEDLYTYLIEVIKVKVSTMKDKIINNSLDNKEKSEPGKEMKINWNKEPEVFFLLFSSLYELGYIDIKKGNNDLQAVSIQLHKLFKVNKKIGSKDEYSETSFIQNLKKTATIQTDVHENVEMKKKIMDLLQSISSS